jgi:tetratricopeptide (TPR) repeat protein
MRAMLHRSDGAFRAEAAPGELRSAVDYIEARLDQGLDAEARDELADRLWALALLIEEGELANARERLRRAQEMLDQAMRDGASPDEIAELMEELREAMRDYIRMLAEQPRERGEADPGETMQVTGDQIQELMNRIQELMEEGRMDEAAELMAQLNALLENLQVTEGQGEGGEPMPGSEAMEGLGDTLSEQQDLADDTFRELQEQFGRGERSGEGEGEGENGQGQSLAQRQQDLRERLRDQQLQSLPGEGTPEGDAALDALEGRRARHGRGRARAARRRHPRGAGTPGRGAGVPARGHAATERRDAPGSPRARRGCRRRAGPGAGPRSAGPPARGRLHHRRRGRHRRARRRPARPRPRPDGRDPPPLGRARAPRGRARLSQPPDRTLLNSEGGRLRAVKTPARGTGAGSQAAPPPEHSAASRVLKCQ